MLLYLISELDHGGAEKSLFNLATHLDERFGKPEVACLWGRGEVGAWFEAAGIKVTYLCPQHFSPIRTIFKLRRMLKSGKFKLLHAYLYHANIIGRLAAAGTGVPVVSSIRVAEEDRRFRVAVDRITHRLVKAETCVSESVRRWSISLGIPADKLVTIPNGVAPELWQVSGGKLKAELQLDDDEEIALFVGRLHHQKGPDVFMEAAKRLCPQRQRLHFVFVGDGPLAARLQRQANEANLSRQVHFLNRRDDLPDLMADANLLVLPSRWEGMPNVVLEAMAAGKPVVGSSVGGTPEAVVDGETGLLVPPDDPQALADAVARILDDRELEEAMGRAGRRRVEAEFSIPLMVRRNEELYDAILQ